MEKHKWQKKIKHRLAHISVWTLLFSVSSASYAQVFAAQVSLETQHLAITSEQLSGDFTIEQVENSSRLDWTFSIKHLDEQIEAIKVKITLPNDRPLNELTLNDQTIDSAKDDFFILTPEELAQLTFSTEVVSQIKARFLYTTDGVTYRPLDGEGTYQLKTGWEPKTIPSTETSAEESVGETQTSTTEEQTSSTMEEMQGTQTSNEATIDSDETAETAAAAQNKTTESMEEKEAENEDSVLFSDTPTTIAGDSTSTGSPNVPAGAIQIGDMFSEPNSYKGSGASVKTVQNETDNGGLPYSELSLSGSKTWTSIWSEDRFRMDFSNSFHGSTFVNFGTDKADGFAFVMQNDPKGKKALTTANDSSDGQNLGVYGGTESFFSGLVLKEEVTPESYAIQHSLAVEFDLNANSTKGNAFDVDPSEPNGVFAAPHMAYTFPGNLEKGYQAMTDKLVDTDEWFTYTLGIPNSGRKARIVHNEKRALNGVISANVQDGTWYSFEYDFDKATGNFTYYLENPTTGEKTAISTIPWEDLSSELQLAENGNRAYWGFTAANGSAKGQTKFIFSELPVNADYLVKNNIYNKDNKEISVNEEDDFGDAFVEKETDVRFVSTYTVAADENPLFLDSFDSYVDPKYVDLTDTKNAYDINLTVNGEKVISRTTLDPVSGLISISPRDVKLVAPESIIKVEMKVKPRQTLTSAVKTTYTSEINVSEALTGGISYAIPSQQSYFWLAKSDYTTELTWDEHDPTKKSKIETIDMSMITSDGWLEEFYWRDLDEEDDFSFQLKKNKNMIKVWDDAHSDGTADFHKHSGRIPKNEIVYGTNVFTLDVYRINKDGSFSSKLDTLEMTIEVTGGLSYEVSTDKLKWTGIPMKESKGILSRDTGNDLTIQVKDSRPEEEKSSWSVWGKMLYGTEKPDFKFAWKQQADSQLQSLDEGIKIMDSTMTSEDGYTYKQTWGPDTGVLIDSPNYLAAQEYQEAAIQWNLYDTENPE